MLVWRLDMTCDFWKKPRIKRPPNASLKRVSTKEFPARVSDKGALQERPTRVTGIFGYKLDPLKNVRLQGCEQLDERMQAVVQYGYRYCENYTQNVINVTRHRSGQLVVGGWSSPARPWSIQFTTEAGHRFLWRGGGQKISSLTWPMWPNCLAALLRHQETSRC